MTEPTDLILEILRAIRSDIQDVRTDVNGLRDDIRNLTSRMARVESGIAKLIHESADHVSTTFEQEHRIDGLAQRIERIERRLELRDQ